MTMRVRCEEDLGIEGCDAVVRGETAGEVLREIVPHLRAEHGLELPDADEILEGQMSQDELFEGPADQAVKVTVRRLRDTLNIEPLETPKGPAPAVTQLGE
jgi:predicted small metal-binding protein